MAQCPGHTIGRAALANQPADCCREGPWLSLYLSPPGAGLAELLFPHARRWPLLLSALPGPGSRPALGSLPGWLLSGSQSVGTAGEVVLAGGGSSGSRTCKHRLPLLLGRAGAVGDHTGVRGAKGLM